MKKKLVKEIIAGTVVAGVIAAGYSMACNYECHYTEIATVSYVNCTGDIVTLTDEKGEEWVLEDVTTLAEGDVVRMKMFTNYTENVYDDEIVDWKVVK